MSVSALGRLKNHNVPHLHPNFTMFMPLNRLQLKICAFSGKFNVCSKWVLMSIQELTQILLRISEEKIGEWSLCCGAIYGIIAISHPILRCNIGNQIAITDNAVCNADVIICKIKQQMH